MDFSTDDYAMVGSGAYDEAEVAVSNWCSVGWTME